MISHCSPHVLHCTNHDTTVNVSNPLVGFEFENKNSLADDPDPVLHKMCKGGGERISCGSYLSISRYSGILF